MMIKKGTPGRNKYPGRAEPVTVERAPGLGSPCMARARSAQMPTDGLDRAVVEAGVGLEKQLE